jgi:hypothetical protein
MASGGQSYRYSNRRVSTFGPQAPSPTMRLLSMAIITQISISILISMACPNRTQSPSENPTKQQEQLQSSMFFSRLLGPHASKASQGQGQTAFSLCVRVQHC